MIDVEANSVIADDIKTKLLELDGKFLGKHIKTSNGDIGYHFYLQHQNEIFEEGDIVGFVDNGDGQGQNVQKLTMESCKKVKIKGVITRSQYLEANKPKDKGGLQLLCLDVSANKKSPCQFKTDSI